MIQWCRGDLNPQPVGMEKLSVMALGAFSV